MEVVHMGGFSLFNPMLFQRFHHQRHYFAYKNQCFFNIFIINVIILLITREAKLGSKAGKHSKEGGKGERQSREGGKAGRES